MTREELISALEERGLTVTVVNDDRIKVARPGVGLLAETISIADGRAYWSWGMAITGDGGAAETADRINAVVSVPPGVARNSR